MTEEQIKNMIKEKLLKGFCDEKSVDDQIYNILSDLKKLGYEVEFDTINEGRNIKDGDDFVLEGYLDKVTIDGLSFYIEAEQRSSCSAEPYQYEPELKAVMTESEYEESLVKLKAKFSFREKSISIYSNEKAKVDNKWFDSVELAINAILYGY